MKNIRHIRREMGITQIELSQLTDIPRSRIQAHEIGTRFLDGGELAAIRMLWRKYKQRNQLDLPIEEGGDSED